MPFHYSMPPAHNQIEVYELMIDDLLTMSEIIQCVFEKNRLSLYREAAKEAEDIFDRWTDEIDDLDEDYEPDEFFSD